MQDFILGCKVEIYPQNEQVREFNMRHQLMPKNKWYSSGTFISQDTFEHALPLTEVTTKALLDIPGIKNISVKPYSFTITKAKAFDWETDLYPKIKLAMAKYLSITYS